MGGGVQSHGNESDRDKQNIRRMHGDGYDSSTII